MYELIVIVMPTGRKKFVPNSFYAQMRTLELDSNLTCAAKIDKKYLRQPTQKEQLAKHPGFFTYFYQ
jgi:hypothetical protein